MPKTVTQIREWLDSPNHIKCILADIGYYNGSEQTLYLSTQAYYDGTNEYLPIIVGGLSFSESLSTDLSISISYGTLDLENTGGTYDYLLNYVYKRRFINLYIGDPSWPKGDFTLIFSGLVDNIASTGESQLQITLVDKLENLNEELSSRTVKDLAGYTTQNTQSDKLLPLLFGEAFNVSPILVDNGTGIGLDGTSFDSGPWTANITGITSTVGIAMGSTVSATPGVGRLYGGTPTSCVVSSILNKTTISFTVTGGIRPVPGSITNLIIGGSAIPATSLTVSTVKGTGGPIYKISDSSLDEIIEVRDKAAPIEVYTTRKTYGEFMLKYATFGTVTCSARSLPSSQCTVPELIKYIVKNYGTNRLTDGDLDLNSISTDRAAYKAGIYVTDRANILDICNQLAKSINCGLYYTLFTVSGGNVTPGKLKLIELKEPTLTGTVLDDSMMLEGTLQISESFSVKPAIKLAFCKNYTQQSQDLALALNPEHANIFSDEYWYVQPKDATIISTYKDTGSIQEELTCLLVTTQATAEANKRLDLWKTQRQLITATYLPHLIFTQLGDLVTIKSSRFNIGTTTGKPGLVYSISRNWITGFVEIGVLV